MMQCCEARWLGQKLAADDAIFAKKRCRPAMPRWWRNRGIAAIASSGRKRGFARLCPNHRSHANIDKVRLLSHLLEVVRAFLVRRNDVEQPVAVDIGYLELRAHAAVVIELMR